jgi:hypothetical protein
MLTKGAAVTTAGKARQQSQQTSPLNSQFLRVGSHDWVSGTNEAVVKQSSRGHLCDIFEILNSLHQELSPSCKQKKITFITYVPRE